MLLLYLQEYPPRNPKELAKLCRESFELDWDIKVEAYGATPSELLQRVKRTGIPALFIMEDAEQAALDEAVASIREQNALHYLVLVLCSAKDALKIRLPYYRPSGFLTRPIAEQNLWKLLEVIYNDYSTSFANYGGYFSMKIRGTAYHIPYDKILFFESCGKKIVVRTSTQQYEFYSSLEDIAAAAPDFFLRVHRSVCVNTRQISSVNFSERIIYLSDGSCVPFSRTYKQMLLKAT